MTKGNLPLLDLLYSAVIEYQLLDEIVIENPSFSILVARLDFTVYIFIEDDIGLHCIEWSDSVLNISERTRYWKNTLESGITKVLSYKIPRTYSTNTQPDSLKFTEYELQPKKKGN